MASQWGWRLVDLAGYAVGLTVAVLVVLVPPSLLVGAGWSGVKFGLFLVGTLAFGYATYLLWPARPEPTSGPDRADGSRNAPGQPGTGGADGPGAGALLGRGGDATGDDRLGRRLRPDRRGGPREATRFEAALDRFPPLSWSDLRPGQRFHPGTKLYVASFLMLGVSYAMEAVFGVGG